MRENKFFELLYGKRKQLISFAAAGIIVLIPSLLNKLYYYEPDDYLMNLISQGEFGDDPDAYLVFINIILGNVLKVFYSILPDINWFALSYLFTVVFVFSVLMYVFWEVTEKPYTMIIIGFFEMVALYHLTFSVLAYICIAASAVYWMFAGAGKNQDDGKLTIINIVLIGVLFWLGILFRSAVIGSCVAALCPLVIWNISNLKKKSSLYMIIVLVFVFAATSAANKAAYEKDLFWKEYSDYNQARSDVLDYSAVDYESNKETLNGIGISANDLNCMYRWIIADKEVFSEDRLQKIADINVQKYNTDIVNILKQMFMQKCNYYFLIIVIIGLLIACKKERYYILIEALAVYALIASLYFRNRPVLRVMIPIYLIGGLVILYMAAGGLCREKKIKKVYAAFTVCILAVFAIKIISNNILVDKERNERISAYEEVYDYTNENQEVLYAGSSSIINPYAYSSTIFDVGEKLNVRNIIKLGSWDIYSSRYYFQMEQYNAEPCDRLIMALAESDSLQYMVWGHDTGEYQMIINFIEEHSGGHVESTLVREFEDADIKIYKLTLG